MSETIETLILRNLQHNEEFARKVFPFFKKDYFTKNEYRQYFKLLESYFYNYNSLPTKEAVDIEIDSEKATEEAYNNLKLLSKKIEKRKDKNEKYDWLLKKSEEFCKDRALDLAVSRAIEIADKGDSKSNLSKTALPDILSEALAVSFDTNIGHDYFADSDKRYNFYHEKRNKIPSHLDLLNRITGNGIERKTVNCIAASTGIGKTMLLCDLAANYFKNGQNVLYITLEMAEEKISERIDANLMNVNLENVRSISKEQWDGKIEQVKKRCTGKLKVKEFPTSSAGAIHFNSLLKELRQKENFIPDIVVVDYLNICTSNAFKDKSNSYGYIKSICEELRKFAVENEVAVWTATQLNREGTDNTDPAITNVSESMGGPMTFDLLIALISNEQLASVNQIMVKQLKNRYADLFTLNKFNIGVDRAKMKMYDVMSNSSQSMSSSKQSVNKPKAKPISGVKV